MGKRLILLTSDRSFVLPTLIACRQLLEQTGVRQIADALIVTIGLSDQELELLSEAGANMGVSVCQLTLDRELLSNLYFNKTHVPVSTLARLYTPALIDAKYEHVVYIDGDVQIVDEIRPLICYDVPEGKLLAAPDRFMLGGVGFGWKAAEWREDLSYLQALGVSDPKDYFNAGVLAASRSTWASICEEALGFFKANSQLCRFHDQSALNAVCKGATIKLSPAYNFNTSFRKIGAEDFIKPRIIHFTGANKPWVGGSDVTFAASYSSLVGSFQNSFPACYETFSSVQIGVRNSRQQERNSIKSKIYLQYERFVKRRSFQKYLERTGTSSAKEF
jgi:lipopolysaccharide biosynthesis glycosyltransferase